MYHLIGAAMVIALETGSVQTHNHNLDKTTSIPSEVQEPHLQTIILASPQPNEDLQDILKSYLGEDRTLSDLTAARDALIEAYRNQPHNSRPSNPRHWLGLSPV